MSVYGLAELRDIAARLVGRCETCGATFTRGQRRFCSEKCRNFWINHNTDALARSSAVVKVQAAKRRAKDSGGAGER